MPVIKQQHSLKSHKVFTLAVQKHFCELCCFSLSSNGNPEHLQCWSLVLRKWKVASGWAILFDIWKKKGKKKERKKRANARFLVLNKKTWHSGEELLGFTWEHEQICMPQMKFSLQAVTRSRQTVLFLASHFLITSIKSSSFLPITDFCGWILKASHSIWLQVMNNLAALYEE